MGGDLLDASLREFLDTLSGEGPAPGGGSAAAVVVAMAAGLVTMVARASSEHWDEAGGVVGQAETFRARVAPLAQADADAYEAALGALRDPEQLEERYRDQKLQAALAAAAEIPQRIAEAGSDLACLAALLVENGNPEVRVDAAAASVLAESGTRVAAKLVETNLGATDDDPRVRHVRTLVVRRSRGVRSARSPPRSNNLPMAQADPTNEPKMPQELRPAWSLPAGAAERDQASRRVARRGHARLGVGRLDREGRARLHPRQRRRRRPSARRRDRSSPWPSPIGAGRRGRSSTDDTEGDLCGHGTACAGIVRSLAPDCEIISVRVLGAGFTGSGGVLLAGLRWAVEQGFDVDQHEPLDDEAPVRRDPPRARPTRPTSAARCSSPPRTTCRSRATRGASPR